MSIHKKSSLLPILALLLLSADAAYPKTSAPAEQIEALAPTRDQSKTLQEAIKKLDRHHYKSLKLDDQAGEKVLERYTELLDPIRIHFLAEDITRFEGFASKLDDDLKRGDLERVFRIYNRFHEQRAKRLHYMLDGLAERIKSMDFEKDEYLELDREKAPWPANEAAAEDIWRKFLKYDVLNLKLTGKSPEEITATLEKRYHSQLRQHQLTNTNDVFELFMNAYTHSYDPHTDYMPPRESENFDIHMSGSLEGIGALLQRDDEYVKVVELITGGPAERSKQLQPADRIVGVGQGEKGEIVDVIDWRLDDVVDLIRGPKDSVVRLNILPANTTDVAKTKVISIVRDKFNLEDELAQKKVITLKYGDTAHKIGVITLPAFYFDYAAASLGISDYRSSARDVEKLIQELKKEQIEALIIDLRNNGGGSLEEAKSLTGLFIKTGPVVQIRYQGNIQLLGDNHPDIAYSGPMAILVNRLSASASEILAGAIQDYGRGIVVGNQTYGKGTVQNVEPLDPGRIKFTQAKFYRISGDSTQSRGVIPDIEYPALIDPDEIGENSLPDALEWDRIPSVRYQSDSDIASELPTLKKKHEQRAASDPDFRFMQKRIEFVAKEKNDKLISLRESVRRKENSENEKYLLDMENERRAGKGLKPYKTFADLEKESEKPAKTRPEVDLPDNSLLQETGFILLDMIANSPPSRTRIAAWQ
ncbi:MAG TPA: carboxy terminal-processing peptidase [Gammaproteobacteria bacterium]|nr:carboxy terminal-processing peptidase [Gammaproteobacteria bacterium]